MVTLVQETHGEYLENASNVSLGKGRCKDKSRYNNVCWYRYVVVGSVMCIRGWRGLPNGTVTCKRLHNGFGLDIDFIRHSVLISTNDDNSL
jgi:hypothetical protein